MKKYIPDAITLMNLLCGISACVLAMWGQYVPAFLFLLGSVLFDFLDGLFARLLGVVTPLGKQLDSLSDLVSFGLAPALMAFNWYLYSGAGHTVFAYAAFFYTCCAALRLARFNIDPEQKTDFRGLAVPAAAMILAPLLSFAQVCDKQGTSSFVTALLDKQWFLPLLTVVLGVLMVSRIPMFSLKGKKLSLRRFPMETVFFIAFIVIVLPLAVLHGRTAGAGFFYTVLPLAILFAFLLYILINIVAAISHRGRAADSQE